MKVDAKVLSQVVEISKEAGLATLAYFQSTAERLNVQRKADNTPLTEADLAANAIVEAGLQARWPEIPLISEEGEPAPYEVRKQHLTFWLVDPLDGTRGFVQGCKEYTVNIALIHNNVPVLGVIYAPALDLCYYAAQAVGAFKQVGGAKAEPLCAQKISLPNLRVVLGRYLSKTKLLCLYEQTEGSEILRLNSSLKFCWIAEGSADLYPRLGETGEWDTAAGQCILAEAGGVVADFTGKPLQYNLRTSLINPPFIALGDPSKLEHVIQFIQEKRRSL